jgi:hypothetical protein
MEIKYGDFETVVRAHTATSEDMFNVCTSWHPDIFRCVSKFSMSPDEWEERPTLQGYITVFQRAAGHDQQINDLLEELGMAEMIAVTEVLEVSVTRAPYDNMKAAEKENGVCEDII